MSGVVSGLFAVSFATSCVVAADVWAYSSQRITNATGQTVAHIVTQDRRTTVRNACGGNIGYVEESGTYDNTGRRISQQALPGLLITTARLRKWCPGNAEP